jgi:hypothetical protein
MIGANQSKTKKTTWPALTVQFSKIKSACVPQAASISLSCFRNAVNHFFVWLQALPSYSALAPERRGANIQALIPLVNLFLLLYVVFCPSAKEGLFNGMRIETKGQ